MWLECYTAGIEDFTFEIIEIGQLETGELRGLARLSNLRIYKRTLMNKELIVNHNVF